MKYWIMIAEGKAASSDAARSLEGWDSSVSTTTSSDVQVGDAVLLWRGGRGGGIVAVGKITGIGTLPPSLLLDFAPSREGRDGRAATRVRVAMDFTQLRLARPISTDALRAAGLTLVAQQARSAGGDHKLVQLQLTEDQWGGLVELADDVESPSDWPATWNIPAGHVVKRAEVHQVYGGNPRLSAGSSAKTPNAFLFIDSSRTGDLAVRWDGPVLLAPGQAQSWDSVSLENVSVLAHLRRGTPVRLFLTRGADCLYVGEAAIDLARPVERWVELGERAYPYYGRVLRREVRAPIFRLHLLNGAQAAIDSADAFQRATRMSLSLYPTSDQPLTATIRALLTVLENDPAIAASLSELSEAQVLATLAQHARRQADLTELRAAAEDPASSEADLQKLLQRMTWIFGDRFLPGTGRRTLTLRDQLDLTLLRPDGTLHGVELKKANIKRLVTGYRNHWILGPKVHEAIGQAVNYLVELDEKRAQLLVDLGIDSRRASMTVVIGHSALVTTGASAAEVDEAFRTWNAQMTRVNVITYDRLIENAQRTLDLPTLGG
ncbi:Shedu anti-phage system protein SduA domain-containing protein [Kitasatospora sp. HPMI-4]|uniref:Shedu anti-phage system protein SduA domain-containing protein n=1 Tax=Kitasatospora sp. HPMI-4 TaxID=3448443 RepID=UPI003F1C5D36